MFCGLLSWGVMIGWLLCRVGDGGVVGVLEKERGRQKYMLYISVFAYIPCDSDDRACGEALAQCWELFW